MNNLVIVRGGGDLASGAILKLHRCGFRVLVLESDDPSCIRRTVSFGDSVHIGSVTLEGTTAVFAGSTNTRFNPGPVRGWPDSKAVSAANTSRT
jgi:xanthine dehydrogenase accessory factor